MHHSMYEVTYVCQRGASWSRESPPARLV